MPSSRSRFGACRRDRRRQASGQWQRRSDVTDLAAAVTRLDGAHRRLVAAVDALPREKLGQSRDPRRPDDRRLDTIAGNTYEHEEEHLEWVRELAAAR
jgi:hypothetical protein